MTWNRGPDTFLIQIHMYMMNTMVVRKLLDGFKHMTYKIAQQTESMSTFQNLVWHEFEIITRMPITIYLFSPAINRTLAVTRLLSLLSLSSHVYLILVCKLSWEDCSTLQCKA